MEQPTSCSNPTFPMMKYYTMVQQCNPGPNEYSQPFQHTQAIGGQMPQAGQYFYMSAMHDYSSPPSSYAWNGNWVAYEVISVSGPCCCDSPTNSSQNLCEISGCNASLPPPFYNNSPYDACTPPQTNQDHVCQDANCLDCSVSTNTQYCNAPGATIYPDLAACQTVLAANKGRCPLECSATCDASAWSNHANWISTWTSLPNFTSSNPNQPCQHICQKITQWTAACANAGPVQQNQLACKIAEGQNQHTIHNCSNSNASAC